MSVMMSVISLLYIFRYLMVAVNSSKKSPEVIQLLDMHAHFSSATPGIRVCTYRGGLKLLAMGNF